MFIGRRSKVYARRTMSSSREPFQHVMLAMSYIALSAGVIVARIPTNARGGAQAAASGKYAYRPGVRKVPRGRRCVTYALCGAQRSLPESVGERVTRQLCSPRHASDKRACYDGAAQAAAHVFRHAFERSAI